MKRIITVTVTVITAAAVLLGLAATSSAAIPVPGTNCSFSVQYLPDPDLTTMYFSYSNGLFQTPLARSGACGHAYVESLGVAAAPPCFIARIRTYNEDRTPNYDGPYMQWTRTSQIRDIRNGYISNHRLYRIFAVPCDPFYRNPSHPPGFAVYTHAA
jgi:hypothetical protein